MTTNKKELLPSWLRKNADIAVFCILLVCAAAFLVWKAFYGFGNRDEAFYLTVAKRLLQGDSPITEEWHVSQLSGLLLLPVMGIYLAINPSCEGMILHFRLIYVIFQIICSSVLFLRLRKTCAWGALVGSLIFMIYAPFNIMALSYNSMGIGFFALSTVLFATRPEDKVRGRIAIKNLFYDILTGILFAAAVLCCPYLAALFFIYAAAVAVIFLLKRIPSSGRLIRIEVSLPALFGITVGIFAAALAFFVFLFSRATLSHVIDAVPMILGDPEHLSIPFVYTVKFFFGYISTSNMFAAPCFILTLLLALTACIDRHSPTRRFVCFIAAAAVTAVYAAGFADTTIVNCVMMPMNLLGFVSFFLLEKRPSRLFYLVFLPTFFYSYAISASSNQCFLVVSSVFSVGTVVSICFIALLIGEFCSSAAIKTWAKPICAIAALLPLCLVTVVMIKLRADTTFWDNDTKYLNARIGYGINRGIITTDYMKSENERLLRDTEEIRSLGSGNVLYFSTETGLYLADAKRNSSFSSWISIGNQTSAEVTAALVRLADYYRLNPDKRPDYVYVDIMTHGTLQKVIDILELDCNSVVRTDCGRYILYCKR